MSAAETGFVPVDAAQRAVARGATAASRRGRWLVEASAGTGKTSVLVDRALAYVLAGERRLRELAIITFTEAAAAELKMRLRQAVGEELRRAGEEARARLIAALADLEVAPIGTIHAFCVELLRLRPVEAGLDPSFTVADEVARKLLFAEVWDDWLRQEIPEQAFEAALDLGFDSEEALRTAAIALANLAPEDLPRQERHELEFETAWKQIYETACSGLRASDPKGKLKDHFSTFVRDIEVLRQLPLREGQRKLIAKAPQVKRAGKGVEQRAIALRDEVNEAVTELRERLIHLRLCELAAWLAGAGAAYRRRAERQGRVDFDEQLRRARRLLRDVPAVRADFRRRYPVVMVDEFQDTDDVQTEIVLQLAAGDDAAESDPPRALFLVGDPKQSIYRFRGADLESYNRVLASEIPPERQVALRQSFRPLPALAEFVNQTMARVMAPPPGAALADYEASYLPLAAAPQAVVPRGGGVLHLELELDEGGRGAQNVGAVRAAEADGLARFALQAVRSGAYEVRDTTVGGSGRIRPLRFGDCALLLPKLSELEVYEDAFHRHGVPFRVLAGRHYYKRDEVQTLLGVLRALSDPGDAGAVIAALRGPGFGASDADLLAFALCEPRPRLDAVRLAAPALLATSPDPAAAERCAAALRELVALRAAVIALPLPDLVAEVLERTGLLPYFALQHRGEQRVANLQKAVEVARRVEAAGRGDLQSFMGWMQRLLEDEPEESDSPYLEGEGDALRVTTVHGAKGLEYPVVLLGGMVGSSAPDHGLRSLRRADGGVELRISSKRGTLGWQAAQALEDARELAEQKRLLYVAMTRARDLLVLPHLERGGAGVGGPYSPIFEQLYERGEGVPGAFGSAVRRATELPPGVQDEPARELSLPAILRGDGAAGEQRRLAWSARQRSTLHSALLRPSAGSAPEGPEPEAPGARPSLPPAALAAQRNARHVGTEAHARIAARLRGTALPAVRTQSTGEERRRAADLAERFLSSDLARRAGAGAEVWIEAPLTVRLANGELLDGQLDLAFREDGGFVIVDYKYTRPRRGDAERLQTYRHQLRLYAGALETLTGSAVRAAYLFFLDEGVAEAVDLVPEALH